MKEKFNKLKLRERIAIISGIEMRFMADFGRRPTTNEIYSQCEEINLSPKNLRRIARWYDNSVSLPPEILATSNERRIRSGVNPRNPNGHETSNVIFLSVHPKSGPTR